MTLARVFGGIDPSYTGLACTALRIHENGDSTADTQVFRTKPKDFSYVEARVLYLRKVVLGFFDASQPEFICIEGYSFGSEFKREMMGELSGALKMALFENFFTFGVVPPPTLKSFVTGKGTAPKELMLREVFKKWGYEAPDNNAADSFSLAMLAYTVSTRDTKVAEKLRKKIVVVKHA